MRQNLTDRKVQALKPAPRGKRVELADSIVPGLVVRVTDRGAKSFCLIARYPGSIHPSRGVLGRYVAMAPDDYADARCRFAALPAADRKSISFDEFLLREYGATSLAAAREKARRWIAQIGRGIDPRKEEAQARAEKAARHAVTFKAVVDDFAAEKLKHERRGREAERNLRTEFVTRWGDRPITEITKLDVVSVIREKKKTAPHHARNLLTLIRRFFEWTCGQHIYGIEVSPCVGLKPATIIGEKAPRDRALHNDEILALWRSARRMPYPYGTIYQLLLLSGLRLNEAADASWSEFHTTVRSALRDRRGPIDWAAYPQNELSWTIPADRMKGRPGKARAHCVPLTRQMLELLEGIPIQPGPYLFSHSAGAGPTWVSSRVKTDLDARMLRWLRVLARTRGEDPKTVTLADWRNHDIRRTLRSGLSRLKISEEAREAVLAHAREGIKKVYDTHDYFDEKLEALTLWGERVRAIVEPPPTRPNVVRFAARA